MADLDLWGEAKRILGVVAPALGTALGGPVGGVAVKFIADKLLGNPEATPEEVSKAILGATPEQLIRLREINAEFSTQMLRANVDLEKIAAGDRDSARRREILTGSNMNAVLALIIVVLWGCAAAGMLLIGIPGALDPVITSRILGMLDAATMLVLAYYFGTSRTSAEKDKEISKALKYMSEE